ncbi:MAG: XRE family transcriptional regulator [Actinomycetes bacterium]|jgi:mannose-6-phosphate isomerase-like protein (cupin superfamily)|nr:XRE family transcriptional regulator [Actinomycetes bacterium]
MSDEDLKQLGQRIKGLREACDVDAAELAAELNVPLERYLSFEETGADVPISVIYHMARKFGVDFTEILSGGGGYLDSVQIVRKGDGKTVDRYPGYHFQDLAWRYGHKIMQPLLVTLDPSDDPAALVQHQGQEFNLVLSGDMTLTFDDQEFTLSQGDCAYFNPMHPHGQKCASSVPVVFLTVITE